MNISINKNRKTGVELLKIFATFMIVLYHCLFAFIDNEFLNIQFNTNESFIRAIILSFGYIGDMIFIVCSSFFLVDKQGTNKKKIIKIIINTTLVHYIFLLIYLVTYGIDNISLDLIIRSLTPISSENNWYITCYMLLYFLYPYMNILIDRMDKKEYFLLCLFLFFIYFVLAFLRIGTFYLTKLVSFISIYFIVGYAKKNEKEFCNNSKYNLIMFISCALLYIGLIFINFYIIDVKFDLYCLNNPIVLFMVIGLVDIFNKINIEKRLINTISGLSMFIYLFSNNILFRNITLKNLAVCYATSNIGGGGYKPIIVKILIFSIMIFTIMIIVTYLFFIVFDKMISKLALHINNIFIKVFNIIYVSINVKDENNRY